MRRSVALGALAALVALVWTGLAAPPAAGQGKHLLVLRVDGSINPAVSDYLQKGIEQAAQEGAAAVLIELDTPGGLVSSTKDIIQAMLNSAVPVIVYVTPFGAWAGSAGAFITLAGHVAAMAPSTSIGAAHPVSIGGGGGGGGGGEDDEGARDFAAEKAENFMAAFMETIARERDRNVEWAVKAVRESVAIGEDEALEIGVIDLIASSRAELLERIEGREVQLAGGPRTLELAGAEARELGMSPMNRFLDVLATPDIALLLFLAGLLGLYVEFTNPGGILPGVAGAVCLMLAFIALQILPFSWLGLLLIVGGLGLFVAEIFVTSFGLLFAAGVVCLLLGGSMIFEVPELGGLGVSFWQVLVPAVATLSFFALLVIVLVGRSLGSPQVSGTHELVGMRGRADTPLDPEGSVFLRGEYWNAHAAEPIEAGDRVEVTAVDGLRLEVRKAPPPS